MLHNTNKKNRLRGQRALIYSFFFIKLSLGFGLDFELGLGLTLGLEFGLAIFLFLRNVTAASANEFIYW